jgi:hypothetical protein
MPAKGRQPYKATVSGYVDHVPFCNWFKYIKTAMTNCKDSSNFILTIIETGHQYRWSKGQHVWVPLTKDAPPLADA